MERRLLSILSDLVQNDENLGKQEEKEKKNINDNTDVIDYKNDDSLNKFKHLAK